MSGPEEDRRYVSFDEIVAYREELDAKEALEAAVKANEVRPQTVEIDLETDKAGTDARHMSNVFRALANETRIEILEILMGRPASAGQLARELDERPNNLTRHLAVLEQAGLVEVERSGVTKIYRTQKLAEELMGAVNGAQGRGN